MARSAADMGWQAEPESRRECLRIYGMVSIEASGLYQHAASIPITRRGPISVGCKLVLKACGRIGRV